MNFNARLIVGMILVLYQADLFAGIANPTSLNSGESIVLKTGERVDLKMSRRGIIEAFPLDEKSWQLTALKKGLVIISWTSADSLKPQRKFYKVIDSTLHPKKAFPEWICQLQSVQCNKKIGHISGYVNSAAIWQRIYSDCKKSDRCYFELKLTESKIPQKKNYGLPNHLYVVSAKIILSSSSDAKRFGLTPQLGQIHLGARLPALDAIIESSTNHHKLEVVGEPSVVAIAEQEAKIHSGGEFQVNTSEDQGDSSVAWKKFGISLQVTISSYDEKHGLVNAKISFSQITRTNGATLSSHTIEGSSISQYDQYGFWGSAELSAEEQERSSPLSAQNIPILGPLFRKYSASKDKSTLSIWLRVAQVNSIKALE